MYLKRSFLRVTVCDIGKTNWSGTVSKKCVNFEKSLAETSYQCSRQAVIGGNCRMCLMHFNKLFQ